MVMINWKIGSLPKRLCGAIAGLFREWTLTIRSLTYNEHMSSNYAIDILIEPLFWFVDNFTQVLGKFFVICVLFLMSSVVAIAYWVGLPYWTERNMATTVFLLIIGHWLLVNILFHYYKGVTTPPGYPPDAVYITVAASICKKCIAPKPPRTHHCSVCDKCILAMDHHCPWLNNCVGYYNARYFYLFMVYMVIGVSFIIIGGLDIGYVVLWLGDTGGVSSDNDPALEGHPVELNQSGVFVPVKNILEYDSVIQPREHNLPIPVITEAQRIASNPYKRKAVMYMALINVSVLIALGTLCIMHGKQVTRGETSVESHINLSERKRLGKRFRNPYDFGRRKNWKLFLGLTHGRTFFWNILLPSGHKPTGNGLHYHTVFDTEDWP